MEREKISENKEIKLKSEAYNNHGRETLVKRDEENNTVIISCIVGFLLFVVILILLILFVK